LGDPRGVLMSKRTSDILWALLFVSELVAFLLILKYGPGRS
jgi:hypothetical protein